MRFPLSVVGRNVVGGLGGGAILGALYGLALAVMLVTGLRRGSGFVLPGPADLHDVLGALYLGVVYGGFIGLLVGLPAGLFAGVGGAVSVSRWPAAARWVAAALAGATVCVLSPRPLFSGLTPSVATDVLFLTAFPAVIAALAAYWLNAPVRRA